MKESTYNLTDFIISHMKHEYEVDRMVGDGVATYEEFERIFNMLRGDAEMNRLGKTLFYNLYDKWAKGHKPKYIKYKRSY